MKISVSTYSFGDYINNSKLGIFGVMDKALEMGFEGIELIEGDYTRDISQAAKVGEYAKKINLPIVAFDVGADFTKNGCSEVDEEIARVKSLVDTAAVLGAPIIRHDASYGNYIDNNEDDFDKVLPVIVRACREVTEYAEKKGVRTAIENHGMFVQDSSRIEKIYRGVSHPNFGILCDIGNFMCADEDPNTAVERVAKYTCHVHAKDFHRKSGEFGCPGEGWFSTTCGNFLRGAIIGHGDAMANKSIDILNRIGYDGYITIEFEGLEDNLVGIELGLKNLKRYI